METNNTVSSNWTNQSDDYYYYYDYEDSVNNIPLEEFIPVAIVYGLTLLLGIIGNVLVIFSISRYRRMQSVTNIFLVSLSSADLILVIICVPIKVGVSASFLMKLISTTSLKRKGMTKKPQMSSSFFLFCKSIFH